MRVSRGLLNLPGGISDLGRRMAPGRCGEGLRISQILLTVKAGATHDSILFGRNFFLRRRGLTSFPREVPGCLVGTPKHKVALSEYSLMSRLHVHPNKNKTFQFLCGFISEPVPHAERFPSHLLPLGSRSKKLYF